MNMKSEFLFVSIFCWVVGCTPSMNTELLSGYWQIEKVQQGGETFYPALGNTQYDYYQLTDERIGFRKKISPGIGERLNTSFDQTDFRIENRSGFWQLQFQTPWDYWQETIVKIDSQTLVLEHNSKRYFYQRKRITNEQP